MFAKKKNMAIVYEHLRNDTNEVFYVGMSVGEKRAFDKCKSKRNPHWHNIVKKAGYTVNIVYKDIEHDEAKQIEILLIEKYGRKDLGLGNLVNMTDGGDGALGLICSEETRQKMSEALKGENNPNFGKTTSEETKKKISEARKGEKHHMFGKTTSEETKQKISEALKGEKSFNFGKTFSEETRQKMSESKKGIPSPNKGKTRSEEDKQKISKGSKCRKGVKGYYFNKASKKWIANIFSNKKRIDLGSFNTPGEASEAYQKAKLIYHV
jgi:group I intron endonuclease